MRNNLFLFSYERFKSPKIPVAKCLAKAYFLINFQPLNMCWCYTYKKKFMRDQNALKYENAEPKIKNLKNMQSSYAFADKAFQLCLLILS